MARSGKVTLPWAGKEREFALPIERLIEVQEACDAGPAFVLQRLQSGHWRIEDVREPIRQGLLGGGADTGEVIRLIKNEVEPALGAQATLAELILSAAIYGREISDDPPEK